MKLIISLSLAAVLPLVPFAASLANTPEIGAKAWLLMDGNSGQVLAQHNAEKKLPVASLNKMMTAEVILEEIAAGRLGFDNTVVVKQHHLPAAAAKLHLKNGEHVDIETLLQATVISSANDAAMALAEHTLETESAFSQAMNDRAMKLGMQHSSFTDATGFDTEKQYSSAYDMALLAHHIIHHHSDFYANFRLKQFVYKGLEFYSNNTLLWQDKHVDGLKTGSNRKAGYCIAASAVKNGMRLIVVILGADSEQDRLAYAKRLLNYGYSNYESRLIYEGNKTITRIPLWMGSNDTISVGIEKNLYVSLAHGRQAQTRAELLVENPVQAPVAKGQKIGRLLVKLDDNTLTEVPLVALETAGSGNIFNRISDTVQLWFQ